MCPRRKCRMGGGGLHGPPSYPTEEEREAFRREGDLLLVAWEETGKSGMPLISRRPQSRCFPSRISSFFTATSWKSFYYSLLRKQDMKSRTNNSESRLTALVDTLTLALTAFLSIVSLQVLSDMRSLRTEVSSLTTLSDTSRSYRDTLTPLVKPTGLASSSPTKSTATSASQNSTDTQSQPMSHEDVLTICELLSHPPTPPEDATPMYLTGNQGT